MLKEGTQTRSSKQIAEEIERLGATINITAPWGIGRGQSHSVRAERQHGPMAASWPPTYCSILHFRKSELDKLKQRMKVQLRQQRSSPFFLLQERFDRAVYGNHPAAITAPTPQSMDKITPEMLAKWHAEKYVPQNALLGVAGDVRPGRGEEDVERLAGMEQRRG